MVLAPSRSLLFLSLPSGQLSAKTNQSTWSTTNKCTLQSLCEPLHTVITQCHIQGYTYHKVTSQHTSQPLTSGLVVIVLLNKNLCPRPSSC